MMSIAVTKHTHLGHIRGAWRKPGDAHHTAVPGMGKVEVRFIQQ